MNLQQYLYEYMQQGGRNPGVLKKFVTYLEMNNVEITEYPRVIDQFLDELGFAKTTKRSYKSSCNKFLTYVYAREGLSLPNKTQTLKEQEEEMVIDEEYGEFLRKYERLCENG